MENVKNIMFDLDGTLWSTIDTCVATLAEIKNKYPDITEEISAEQVEKSMGKPFGEIAEMYYGYLGKEKAEQYAEEAFQKEIQNLLKYGGRLYPGTKSTIQKLAKQFKLYIVSNCIEGYIESFFDTTGLGEYFSDFESHGRTGLSKGENIKLVMERNQIEQAIYVGDTISDKVAASQAGIPFAYASYGFGQVEEYDYYLNQIEDLLHLVKE